MSAEHLDRDVQFRGLSAEQRELLMIQVAKRYYELDMTIGDLARGARPDALEPSRLLSDARARSGHRAHRDRAARAAQPRSWRAGLQRRFGLKDEVVVPQSPEDDDALLLDSVAQAAARLIAGLGKVPLIGVSWGRTMSAVARRLPPFWNEGVEVVLLNGAMNIRSPSTRTNNTAELFARAANGMATLLPVPAILGHAATRLALEQDSDIAGVLAPGRRAPVICFGMGARGRAGSGAGAVGLRLRGGAGAAARQGRGRRHPQPLHRRPGRHRRPRARRPHHRPRPVLCAEREFSIGVAAGRAKHAIALACLRAGYLNVLVTDEETALFPLDETHRG